MYLTAKILRQSMPEIILGEGEGTTKVVIWEGEEQRVYQAVENVVVEV